MLLDLQTFRRKLLRWYDKHRRDLPWRVKDGSPQPLNPYHVLLSETMLQQTQVATVIPYFHRFLERFPTLHALAAADEQDVLRLWQGLGYYSRARNLQEAAKVIIARHGGNIPADPDQLLELPGVGRYTAGAVASIAFSKRTPILDGNVQRVLCRLDKIEPDPRDREVQKLLWQRAAQLLPLKRTGDFNSALMELGATVCIPRTPQCLICPVRSYCEAAAAGVQDRIPISKKALVTPLLRRHTYCIRSEYRWLIEQRPARGRWAGMWQFITFDLSAGKPALPVKTSPPQQIATIAHALTHRRYEFEVFYCDLRAGAAPHIGANRRWVTLDEMDAVPLPRPHLKILQILKLRS